MLGFQLQITITLSDNLQIAPINTLAMKSAKRKRKGKSSRQNKPSEIFPSSLMHFPGSLATLPRNTCSSDAMLRITNETLRPVQGHRDIPAVFHMAVPGSADSPSFSPRVFQEAPFHPQTPLSDEACAAAAIDDVFQSNPR